LAEKLELVRKLGRICDRVGWRSCSRRIAFFAFEHCHGLEHLTLGIVGFLLIEVDDGISSFGSIPPSGVFAA
jgi:hypothetical protein